jgi:hypothetical protein
MSCLKPSDGEIPPLVPISYFKFSEKNNNENLLNKNDEKDIKQQELIGDCLDFYLMC